MATMESTLRLRRDLLEILTHPPLDGVSIHVSPDSFFQWVFSIRAFSPDSVCYFSLQFPPNYPSSAPVIKCLTKPQHRHLCIDQSSNTVCLELLNAASGNMNLYSKYDGWSGTYSAFSILLQMQDFFNEEYMQQTLTSTEIKEFNNKVNNYVNKTMSKSYEKMEYKSVLYELVLSNNVNEKNNEQIEISSKKTEQTPQNKSYLKVSMEKTKTIFNQYSILEEDESFQEPKIVGSSTKNKSKKSSTTFEAKKELLNCEKDNSSQMTVWDTLVSSVLPSNAIIVKPDFDLKREVAVDLNFSSGLSLASVRNAKNFGRLPNSVLESILLFLPASDIARAVCSCVFINSVCSENAVWQKLVKSHFPQSMVVPKGVRGTGADWRQIWRMETNGTRYNELTCFLLKSTMGEDVLGVPLDFTVNPKTNKIDYIYSTMELMSHKAFHKCQHRKSTWGEKIIAWIPVYLTQEHFKKSLPFIEQSIAHLMANESTRVSGVMGVLSILPRLMNTMVVLLVDKGIGEIENALRGYCMVHRLFIALVQEFPSLKKEITRRITEFIRCPERRNKNHCSSLGEFLPLLSVCESLGWLDVAVPLLQEGLARTIMWACKDDKELAAFVLKRAKNPKLQPSFSPELAKKLFDKTLVSKKLYCFHCGFLKLLCGPNGSDLNKIARTYDLTFGMPSLHLQKSMRSMYERISGIESWTGFFKHLCLGELGKSTILTMLLSCIDLSRSQGYHHKSTDFSLIQKSGVSSILMRGQSYPRVVLCIDRSGSMGCMFTDKSSGKMISRLDFVKKEINEILTKKLTDRQQFSIIFFDHEIEYYSQELLQVTKPNVASALKFVKNIDSRGGTDFNIALDACFKVPNVQAIYFLSDGEVYENENFANKIKTLSKDGNIHCHTTAFFAPESGQELLKTIAQVSGGSFLNFDENS